MRLGGRGSRVGYLVAPRLVLTAGHVAKRKDGQILFISEGEWRNCRRIWCRDDDDVDAALLEITDPDWRPPGSLSPVRWGKVTGARGGVAWEAVGFPDVQPSVGGLRDTVHLAGTINPGNRARGHRYAAEIAGTPPVAGDTSPWAGLSGAAVFCDELLAGVVAEDPAGWASGRVEAVPLALLATQPGFARLVQQHTGRPLVMESVELSGLLRQPAALDAARSPASLLRAEAAVVRFHGREDVLRALTRWCKPGNAMVRMVTGPGGQGKTRLAQEFAAQMRKQGWVAGWLKDTLDTADVSGRDLPATREPVLIVVDYAEVRAELVASMLSALLERKAEGVRLLLLARSSTEWWEQLKSSKPGLRELLAGAVIDLDPLASDSDGRRRAFAAACKDFAAELASVPGFEKNDWARIAPTIAPQANLEHSRYGQILAVHMAALAALLQAGLAPADAGRDHLDEQVLLDHELRYWQRAASAYRLDLTARSLEQAVAAAALTGALTDADANLVCRQVPGIRDLREDDRSAVASWLHGLYPSADGAHWGTLQPDRLAEYLIGTVTSRSVRFLDEFLPGLPDRLLDRPMTVLGRTWAHQAHVARQVHDVITEHPAELAVAAARATSQIQNVKPVADALNHVLEYGEPSYALAAELFLVIPPGNPLMAPMAVNIGTSLATAMMNHAERNPPLPMFGRILSELCARFWDARHRDEGALSLTTNVIKILRNAVAEDPDQPEGPLFVADALNTLAAQLSERDRYEEALAAVEESISIYQKVATASRHSEAGLTMAMNTYSIQLNNLKRHDEALVAADKTIARIRNLPAEYFERHPHFLAASLGNKSSVLGDLERYNEAITVVDEAIIHQRRLADMRPGSYLAGLAMMLHRRSEWQFIEGVTAQAFTGLTEFIALCEQIRKEYPEALSPFFARALLHDAKICDKLGDAERAAKGATQAVAILRQNDTEPGPHRPQLAEALQEQAGYLRKHGKLLSARQAAESSVKIARELVAQDRSAYLPLLATALVEFGTCQRDLGRSRSSLSAVEEAVACYRELAASSPGRFLYRLSGALNQYSNRLKETGRTIAALPPMEEAASIRRQLAADYPEKDQGGLASTLSDLAMRYLYLDEYQRALFAAEEAITIRRDVLARRGVSPKGDSDLASYSSNRCTALKELNRYDDALRGVDEAIADLGSPGQFKDRSVLGVLQANRATLLQATKKLEPALAAIDQAISNQQMSVFHNTATIRDRRINALQIRGDILQDLGRSAEAIKTLQEAHKLAAEAGYSVLEIEAQIHRSILIRQAARKEAPGKEQEHRAAERKKGR